MQYHNYHIRFTKVMSTKDCVVYLASTFSRHFEKERKQFYPLMILEYTFFIKSTAIYTLINFVKQIN